MDPLGELECSAPRPRSSHGIDAYENGSDSTYLHVVPICLYYLNCTEFGQLILRKIIKIVATICQILRPKYTKFYFGWGSAPDPAGGAYSTPPDPLAGFRGPISKGETKGGEGSTPKVLLK